jgi:hypothetical protein
LKIDFCQTPELQRARMTVSHHIHAIHTQHMKTLLETRIELDQLCGKESRESGGGTPSLFYGSVDVKSMGKEKGERVSHVWARHYAAWCVVQHCVGVIQGMWYLGLGPNSPTNPTHPQVRANPHELPVIE